MKAAACWIIITHTKTWPKTLVCLWVKTKTGFQAVACSLWFYSAKPNANDTRHRNFKIFIYARLLSRTCLILPFLLLLLLFLGNMQSLSGLHPDFHVGSWLLDGAADRRWERLRSQVEQRQPAAQSALTPVSANAPWRAPDASPSLEIFLKGLRPSARPVRDPSAVCTSLWFLLLHGFQARHNDSAGWQLLITRLVSSFVGSFATISINISSSSAVRRPCCCCCWNRIRLSTSQRCHRALPEND